MNKKYLNWIFISAFIIVFLLVLFIPTKIVEYEITVPYEEEEPYITLEQFTETQCYERRADALAKYLDHSTTDWPQYKCLPDGDICGFSETSELEYSITNYEDKSAQFVIKVKYVNKEFQEVEGSGFIYRRLNVGPGETEENTILLISIENNKPQELTTGYFLAYLETPNVIECEDINLLKNVTKYKTVQKTKQLTETKKVNWIFGYTVS